MPGWHDANSRKDVGMDYGRSMGGHSCEHPGRLYIATAARGRGEVAELAAVRKYHKYSDIPAAYTFLPIAMETLGSMNDSAYHFYEDLGRKISEVSGDSREGSFIFQRLSVSPAFQINATL